MLTLYNFAESTCSQKVKICLAEKGLDFEDRKVDFRKGEHLSDDYLSINPNGVVPTLVHNGIPIIESTVIVEYLDEVFPDPPLSFADPVMRARLRAWLHYIDEVPTPSIRIPSINKTVLDAFRGMSAEAFEEYLDRTPLRRDFFKLMGQNGFPRAEYDAALERLRSCAKRMTNTLSENGGPYLFGEQFTLADICLIPTFDRLVDLELTEVWQRDLPRIDVWFRACAERPSFAAAYTPGSRLTETWPVWKWNAAEGISETQTQSVA